MFIEGTIERNVDISHKAERTVEEPACPFCHSVKQRLTKASTAVLGIDRSPAAPIEIADVLRGGKPCRRARASRRQQRFRAQGKRTISSNSDGQRFHRSERPLAFRSASAAGAFASAGCLARLHHGDAIASGAMLLKGFGPDFRAAGPTSSGWFVSRRTPRRSACRQWRSARGSPLPSGTARSRSRPGPDRRSRIR